VEISEVGERVSSAFATRRARHEIEAAENETASNENKIESREHSFSSIEHSFPPRGNEFEKREHGLDPTDNVLVRKKKAGVPAVKCCPPKNE